jgi:hypothetical protein
VMLRYLMEQIEDNLRVELLFCLISRRLKALSPARRAYELSESSLMGFDFKLTGTLELEIRNSLNPQNPSSVSMASDSTLEHRPYHRRGDLNEGLARFLMTNAMSCENEVSRPIITWRKKCFIASLTALIVINILHDVSLCIERFCS